MAEEKNNPQVAEDKAKKNIFAMTFEKQKRGKMELKKKNMQKGAIFLILALALIIPYSIFFLYPQVTGYLSFGQQISSYDKQIKDIEVTTNDLEKTRDLHKSAYDQENKTETAIINKVFPITTEKLEVIRLMEDFATHLNTDYPPFEFTSISFEVPKTENGYTALPFRTNIHSSQTNFDRFLGLINLSGDYKPESKDHVRLMSISNITLTYRGLDKEGVDQGVDFDVELMAYSR